MTDIDKDSDDALVLIYTRNAFYKYKSRVILGVVLLCLIVIAILLGTLIYLIKDPPHPLFFTTDNAGRLLQDPPLQQPNMSDQEIANWVKEAVEAAYSYDFVHYRGQLQSASKYFIEYGWANYMKGLEASDNLIGLAQHKWVVVAKVVSPPKLQAAAQIGQAKVYAWRFIMPVLVTYYWPPYTEKSKVENALDITVVVERQSILSSYKGLGIVQMIGVQANS